MVVNVRRSYHRDKKTCGNILEEDEEEEYVNDEASHSVLDMNKKSAEALVCAVGSSQSEIKERSQSDINSTNSITMTESDLISVTQTSIESINQSEHSQSECSQSGHSQLSTEDSEGSSRSSPSLVNLRAFRCTEKTPFYDEDSAEETEMNSLVDNIMFEHEYYLGNRNTPWERENSLQKLRRRKQERIKERELKKQIVKTERRALSCSVQLSQLSLDVGEVPPIFNMKILQKAPSFMEFLHLLWEEEKYDPRFRRANQKSKNIAKRYKLEQSIFVGNALSEQKEGLDRSKKTRRPKLPKIASNIKDSQKPSVTMVQTHTKNVIEKPFDRHKMAAEVAGVTDSPACGHHVLLWGCPQCKKKIKSSRENLIFEIPKFILTSPSGEVNTLMAPKPCTPPPTRSSNKSNPCFEPKISSKVPSKNQMDSKEKIARRRSSVVKKLESSDSVPRRLAMSIRNSKYYEESSSSSSESEDENSIFDTRRLNKRYSFEKIRGKDYHKKKSVFYDVLKKFCRIQKAKDCFRNISPSGNKRLRVRRRGVAGLKSRKSVVPGGTKGETMEVGVLQWYKFLQYRRDKQFEPIETPDFSSISLLSLRENVLKALGQFVVRKERVISDHGFKSSITLTFTRKNIFSKKLSG